jgi:nitrous oxidase accessory protein
MDSGMVTIGDRGGPGATTTRGRRRLAAFVLALLVPVAIACSRGPRPIRPGRDRCAFCRMTIEEPRFAAELVSDTGAVQTFDSIDCLVGFLGEHQSMAPRSVWVANFRDPSRLIDAYHAFYAESTAVHGPMGRGLTAFASRGERDASPGSGRALAWTDVMAQAGLPAAGAAPAAPPAATGGGAGTTAVSGGALAALVRAAAPGDRVVVPPGVHREPTLVIDKPLVLEGQPGASLDGNGERTLIVVRADHVTIRGLRLAHVGTSYVEDRAAIRVERGHDCVIEDTVIDDAFFGIYLSAADGCAIRRNRLAASGTRETSSGNGIHLWSSSHAVIEDNVIRGYRDGIYFEFVKASRIARNRSEGNLRYGLHFMFSDDCSYADNIFAGNGAGVAVMYTTGVEMAGNTFADNWGPSSFGLLLKDIRDSRIVGNVFRRNSVGLYAEATDRVRVTGNDFTSNGWGLKVLGNSEGDEFAANNFVGNSFDVVTNSRLNANHFEGNYWDAYRGYDLDHDGIGDVPYRPVRLFAYLVERHDPALILLRSPIVQVLDAAEAVLPALTPEALVDRRPRMKPAPRPGVAGAGGGRP